VDSIRSVLEKIDSLSDRMFDSDIVDFLLVITGLVQLFHKPLWKTGPAQLRDSPDLPDVDNGKQSRNNRLVYSNLMTALQKAVEMPIVIEELSQDQVGPGVNLPLQITQISFKVTGFDVFLRVSGDRDPKPAPPADVLYEFVRVPESIRTGLKVGLSLRRVAPQRHDILYSLLLNIVQCAIDI
jgi:hypothetical protein